MEIYKNKVIIYVAITYLLSWLIWLSLIINNFVEPKVLITLGTFIPSVIGISLYMKLNHISLRKYIKRQFNFKLKINNYLIIFILPLLIIGIAYAMMRFFEIETPNVSYVWYELPLVFVTILFLMGPIGEEFGWRGYLYPVIKEKYSLFQTSLIIGVIWSIWHLPLFFIHGALQNEFTKLYGIGLSIIGYLFYTIILSFLISVYYEKTNRSIVTPLIMHTMANLSIGYLPIVFNKNGALIQLSVMLVVSIIIFLKNYKIITKKP